MSDSPDVLAEIEALLEEHSEARGLVNKPYKVSTCIRCRLRYPCDAFKALTGWKKAEIANRQRRSEAEDALRGLTPGGSEFQAPEECVAFVWADRESARRAMLAFKLRADKAEEEKRELVEALRWAVADLKNWATRLTVRGNHTSLSNAGALLAAKECA